MNQTTLFTSFDPASEVPGEDERKTTEEMIEALRHIAEVVNKDEGHAYRGVHAKSHGLIEATVTVPEGLPAAYAQGLFATPGRYRAVIRLSTPPGDLLDDKVSTPRGFAIKIFDVPGVRLPGSAVGATQDFVMINSPTFSAPNPQKFLKNLKLLSATTDKAPGLKKAFSAALRGTEAVLEKTGLKSATLVSLGGHPLTNILGETFHSAAAMRYGSHVAKISIAPDSASLRAHTDETLDMSDDPDALRHAVQSHFAHAGARWAIRAQLQADRESMPIDDPTVPWDETVSPPLTVATIDAEPQPTWNAERIDAIDDGLAFSPWNSLAEHQPLGSVMRVRRDVYIASARFRQAANASATPTRGAAAP